MKTLTRVHRCVSVERKALIRAYLTLPLFSSMITMTFPENMKCFINLGFGCLFFGWLWCIHVRGITFRPIHKCVHLISLTHNTLFHPMLQCIGLFLTPRLRMQWVSRFSCYPSWTHSDQYNGSFATGKFEIETSKTVGQPKRPNSWHINIKEKIRGHFFRYQKYKELAEYLTPERDITLSPKIF